MAPDGKRRRQQRATQTAQNQMPQVSFFCFVFSFRFFFSAVLPVFRSIKFDVFVQ